MTQGHAFMLMNMYGIQNVCRIDILSFAFHCILFTSSPFILLQLPYIDAVWTLVNLHFLLRTALKSGFQVFSLIRFSCHAHSHHTLYLSSGSLLSSSFFLYSHCSFIPSRTWFLSSAPNKLNCNGQNVLYYFNERVFLIVAKFMTSLQGGS